MTRLIAGREVSALGFGCMNLNHAYQPTLTREQSLALLQRAFDAGVTHFDTAALYGLGRNEEWVGEGVKSFRSKIFLASKCGMTGVSGKRVIDGRPETLLKTCEESLRRLQVEYLDLYYLHRWDKRVPIEESVGALGEMVRKGWVRSIGLSEVSSVTLRKAHAIHPIAAIQNEYSLWTRDPERVLLKTCEELNIALVAFSPLGRGMLAGGISDSTQLAAGDIRRSMPRFQAPYIYENLKLYRDLQSIAQATQCTPAQLSLAWLLHKAPNVIPIFGTTSASHLTENLVAAQLSIDQAVFGRLEACINAGTVSGFRYPAETMQEIDQDPV